MNYTEINKVQYFRPAKINFHPAFDGLSYPFCRVCLGIAIGSDVLPKRLYNFGPVKAYAIKQEIDRIHSVDEKQNQVVKSILSHDQKQKENQRRNIDENTLRCLAASIMFEPTYAGYIYTSPEDLDEYLKDYKLENDSIRIKNDVEIPICHGLTHDDPNAKHKFISSVEREYTCTQCKYTYCEHCMYNANDKSDEHIYIRCTRDPSLVDVLPSEKDRRSKLNDHGINLPNDAAYGKVVREYKASSDGGIFDIDFASADIKYPLEGPDIFLHSNNVLLLKRESTVRVRVDRGLAVTATNFIKEVGTNLGPDRIFAKCISAEEKHGDLNMVNESLAELVDISKEDDNTPPPILGKRKIEYEKKKPDLKPSLFSFEDLTPNEIHRRTGFSDLFCLLSYITTICGSDMTLILKTSSSLTWLEEWMMFLEYIYGRTHARWIDYQANYKLKIRSLFRVFKSKLDIAIKARNRWPMYVSHKEDCKFRNEQWDKNFKNKRVVMHDNTNVNLVKPTSADQ